jgi:hypothetical protein
VLEVAGDCPNQAGLIVHDQRPGGRAGRSCRR